MIERNTREFYRNETEKNIYRIFHGSCGGDSSDLCGADHVVCAHQLRSGAVFLGCLLSNLLCGAAALDVIFGSLATLIGAVGSYVLREYKWAVCVPPILSNTIIIPWVLRYAYGSEDMILFAMVTVGIGEVLAIGVLGNGLRAILERYRHILFEQKANFTEK